ncbi:hypothetical protein DRQ25_15545 [Candidatus Fermentibacteria bacterium]|nr:MAG: hypothetical protein DRQ25_15545 [Candidatus Fermentibacteria bacterium]
MLRGFRLRIYYTMEELNLDSLSKGSLSMINHLKDEYGSIEAVIESSVILLHKLVKQGQGPDREPNYQPAKRGPINKENGTLE